MRSWFDELSKILLVAHHTRCLVTLTEAKGVLGTTGGSQLGNRRSRGGRGGNRAESLHETRAVLSHLTYGFQSGRVCLLCRASHQYGIMFYLHY
ncbi:hypothetical protein RRG08_000557 [Elysia crispata]|uniref:Uncharacterized protein n=1 Tax=Elysia crispata TaxID=231223 RepID=A0AAE1CUG1_9GAST|nr:hypothetical protein RRG08_000557 [Elysia crispata]